MGPLPEGVGGGGRGLEGVGGVGGGWEGVGGGGRRGGGGEVLIQMRSRSEQKVQVGPCTVMY